MNQQSAHEDRDQQMRRLRHATRSDNTSRLDGAEAERAIVINRHAAEAGEPRRKRLVLGIVGMRVSAMLVRLPNFENGIIDGLAIAIQNAPPNQHFSGRLCGWREVVDVERFESDAEVGAYSLRCGGGQVHVTCPAASHYARATQCRSDIPARAPAPWCLDRNQPPAGSARVHWQCC